MALMERVCRKLDYLWRKHVTRDPMVRGVDVWYAVTPSGAMLFEHRLPVKPVIFDIGGFTGVATAEVAARYPDATLHVFEPLPEYVQQLQARFKGQRGVKIYPYGVAAADGSIALQRLGEGSSAFRDGGGETVDVPLRGVVGVMSELSPGGVDLMMINAEGVEYEILDQLLAHGLMAKVGTLVVQFHPVVPGYWARYRALQQALAETHTLVFGVPFVWEKWVRK